MKRTALSTVLCVLAATALRAAAPGTAHPDRIMSPRTRIAAAVASERADSLVGVYIHFDAARLDRAALRKAGVMPGIEHGTVMTARVASGSLGRLADVEGVTYVETASRAHGMMDIARPETGGSAVIAGEGLDRAYSGKGVIVGIVDSGFDYGHTAFRDADGRLRILRVWEQATQPKEGQASPAAFGYGLELSDEQAILDSGGDIINNSHGTHVTSIAAGSDSRLDGILLGMAPDADIVLVSMTEAGTANVAISDAIAYIFAVADAEGKPCVVNLSLGNQAGPHDGTSTFDVLADAMQGPGRLIVGAAGNHRPTDLFHVHADFTDATSAPLRSFLDFRTSALAGDVELWSSADAMVDLTLVKLSTGEVTERVNVYPADVAEASLGSNVKGTIAVAAEKSPLNGKIHVLASSKLTSVRTGYAVAMEVTPLGSGSADIWADNISLGLNDNGLEGYASPKGTTTICEIGGTAKRILTVGAYTTRADYRVLGESADRHLDETDGALSSFSCYGPTADGRMKPQIAAPGCFISAAVSGNDKSGTAVYSRHFDDTDDFYGYMQGTSMAAPLVTGVVATWLEAYPTLTPEQLAEVAARTSRTDEFTGAIGADGDNRWGYGKIDALEGLRLCQELAREGGIDSVEAAAPRPVDDNIYDLRGVVVRHAGESLDGLAQGFYLKGREKIVVR